VKLQGDDLRKKDYEEKHGPTKTEGGYWRIKTNQEINNILKGQNIIGFIKNKD
jgi:hypothetical protein